MRLFRDQARNHQEWKKIHDIAKNYFAIPGVVKQSVHILLDGDRKGEYIDFDMIISDPVRCEHAMMLFVNQINEICNLKDIDFLAFVDKGGEGTVGTIALAGVLEISTSLPAVYVRPWKDIRAERIKSRYNDNMHNRLYGTSGIFVTDHCTTGREALRCVDLLEENGAMVKDVVAYSYRVEDFDSESFTKKNIDFYSIYNNLEVICKTGV